MQYSIGEGAVVASSNLKKKLEPPKLPCKDLDTPKPVMTMARSMCVGGFQGESEGGCASNFEKDSHLETPQQTGFIVEWSGLSPSLTGCSLLPNPTLPYPTSDRTLHPTLHPILHATLHPTLHPTLILPYILPLYPTLHPTHTGRVFLVLGTCGIFCTVGSQENHFGKGLAKVGLANVWERFWQR